MSTKMVRYGARTGPPSAPVRLNGQDFVLRAGAGWLDPASTPIHMNPRAPLRKSGVPESKHRGASPMTPRRGKGSMDLRPTALIRRHPPN